MSVASRNTSASELTTFKLKAKTLQHNSRCRAEKFQKVNKKTLSEVVALRHVESKYFVNFVFLGVTVAEENFKLDLASSKGIV